MTILIKPVTTENLDEEMEPCLEDTPAEKRAEFSIHCQSKKAWFKIASDRYGVCGFMAYLDGGPAGLIEFLPVNAVPYPAERPKDTMYILCAYVKKDSQKKGVGRELLSHLIRYLATTPVKCFDGRNTSAVEVYVPCPNPEWPANIQFPAGGIGFYEKFGFRLKKELPKQEGYLYRLELRHEI